ncbi:MAG TPA: hypothetical protein VMF32_24220, partial [Xanthobacteraceae bacterium]|nr:hypothetical protein [Xanthobacteraceae bacterium]
SMSCLGYAGLSAALALSAGAAPGADPPSAAFAPSQCAYSVSFPAQPSISQSTTSDGGKNVAADLVRNGVRLSAACLAAPAGWPTTALAPGDVAAHMAQMARALGVQNAQIHSLPKLSAGCGEIEGTLGEKAQPYRIEARICIAANATFIAETIARTDDATTRIFLDSLAPK